MLKNISQLQCNINGKTFQFLCDHDSPLGDVKNSLFEFLKFVGNVEDSIKAMQQQESQQEKLDGENCNNVEDSIKAMQQQESQQEKLDGENCNNVEDSIKAMQQQESQQEKLDGENCNGDQQ